MPASPTVRLKQRGRRQRLVRRISRIRRSTASTMLSTVGAGWSVIDTGIVRRDRGGRCADTDEREGEGPDRET